MLSAIETIFSFVKQAPIHKKIIIPFLFIVLLLRLSDDFHHLFSSFIIPVYGQMVIAIAAGILKILGHVIFTEANTFRISEKIYVVNEAYLAIYWLLGLLFILYITPSERKNTFRFSSVIILLNIFFNILRIVLFVILLPYIDFKDRYLKYLISAGITLLYLFLLYRWYNINRNSIRQFIHTMGIDDELLRLILVNFIAMIVAFKIIAPVLVTIDLSAFVRLILLASKFLLSYLNVNEVEIYNNKIFGIGKAVYVAKSCIGIKLMLVYAALIIFTGKNWLRKISWALVGVIIINILNVIRIVMLYYLQGNSSIKIDVHFYFNVGVYTAVFFLWIIWFEKISDHPKIRELMK